MELEFIEDHQETVTTFISKWKSIIDSQSLGADLMSIISMGDDRCEVTVPRDVQFTYSRESID